MIQVRDLRVDYDDVCAVNELSFEVHPGEIYGMVGPNGAGKTTTLLALTGLLEPTYGDILLNGIDLSVQREEALRTLGFMPDEAMLYPDLSVWEFLDLFAASYGVPRDERRQAIDNCLELVDLTEKREAVTGSLSRGMQQRLMLAKTLIPDPSIILLDEPASGLDPFARALLKDILRQLGSMGKTIVISSHILTELSEFCTSMGIMERGRLVISGRVEDVAARVLGQVEVQAEVIGGYERLLAVLEEDPLAGAVTGDAHFVTFPYAGDPEQIADLLGRLVAAGVRLAGFGRKKENLEEVFLKVGAREVS